MPIPVPIPGGALTNDDLLTAVAEQFVAIFAQCMAYGTAGGTLTTPAFLVPTGPDPAGSSTPVLLDSAPKQLMYRQMGLAIASMLRSQIPTVFSFQRTADIGGVAAGKGVVYSSNDKILAGDSSSNATSGCIGVATSAIAAGTLGTVVALGLITGILSGAMAGAAYYLGHDGTPVLIGTLSTGDQKVLLGYAKNSTDLEVNIQRDGLVP